MFPILRLCRVAWPLLGLAVASLAASAQSTPPTRTLADLQRTLGSTNYVWDGDSLCLSNKNSLLRFHPGRKKAEVNGTVVWLNHPAQGSPEDDSWRIASVDLDHLALALLPGGEGTRKPLRVMLDPGHGGDDEGASSQNPPLKEKDLTLSLALEIGRQLSKKGMHVAYTRTNDTTLALSTRTRMARKMKADLFVSIHANHAANLNATGVESYIVQANGFAGTADGTPVRGWQAGNRHDYHNTLLGFSVHSRLAAIPGTLDRGLKRQSFYVLREAACPAVLLEFGFLSNLSDVQRMRCPKWRARNCAAVAAGIQAYARKVGALDLAVAEKRKRDAEANERWLAHLAARQKSTTAPRPSTSANQATMTAQDRAPAHSPLPSAAAPGPVAAASPARPAKLSADLELSLPPPRQRATSTTSASTIFGFYLGAE